MAAVGVFLLASSAAAADCNQATPAAVTRVALPGHPFSAIPNRDGCTIFVSLTGGYQSQLLVMSRVRGSITLLRRLFITGILTGMALSPDGRFLAAATYTGVTIFDVGKLIGRAGRPIVASSNDGPHAGSIYVAFTADRRLLFVANERSASLRPCGRNP